MGDYGPPPAWVFKFFAAGFVVAGVAIGLLLAWVISIWS